MTEIYQLGMRHVTRDLEDSGNSGERAVEEESNEQYREGSTEMKIKHISFHLGQ